MFLKFLRFSLQILDIESRVHRGEKDVKMSYWLQPKD